MQESMLWTVKTMWIIAEFKWDTIGLMGVMQLHRVLKNVENLDRQRLSVFKSFSSEPG